MKLDKNIVVNRVVTSITKVYRRKVSGLVAHVGLELNFESGEPLVIHTNPDKNTHLSTIEEFSDGETLVRKTKIDATKAITDRINSKLSVNQNYSILNNCEHLASELLTGCPTSDQLKTSLTVSAIGTSLVACKPANRNMMTLSFAALAFGVLGLCIEKHKLLSA